MKDDNRNYIIVGLFVLSALAGLLVWLALLTGRTGATDSYYVLYDNVMGLQSGTQVLFEGYPIGFIDGIEPVADSERQRFRVDVSVQRGWRIPANSLARITAPGLLSAFAIDIRTGSARTLLAPGDAIPGVAAPVVLDVVAQVNDLLREKVDPWLSEMASGTLAISANLEGFTVDLGNTMSRVDKLIGETNLSRIDQILVNLEASTENVASVAADLDDTQRIIQQLLNNVDGVIAANQADLTQAIGDARFALEALSRYIESISYNLDASMRNMSEFSREIRKNPGVLLRGRSGGDGTNE